MPSLNGQFRVKHLLILTTIVAGLLIFSRFVPTYNYWIGGFDLQVSLVGDPGAPIRTIDAYPLQDDLELELFKANALEGGGLPQRVTFSTESSFQVRLKTMGKSTASGREISYHQPQYLGVILTLGDGTSRRDWVELPDGRESRRVELKLGDKAPPARP